MANKLPSTSGKPSAVRMDRRQALQLFGSVGVAGGLAAGVGCKPQLEPSATAIAALRTLSDDDFKLLSRLTELIIPKTNTAGAVEAGVPEFIDSMLLSTPASAPAAVAGSSEVFLDNMPILFADGFRWIDQQAQASHGKLFLELSEVEQFTWLEAAYAAAEEPGAVGRSVQFLRVLKSLTAGGYYTSQQGLLQELGYKGNAPHDGMQVVCEIKPSTV